MKCMMHALLKIGQRRYSNCFFFNLFILFKWIILGRGVTPLDSNSSLSFSDSASRLMFFLGTVSHIYVKLGQVRNFTGNFHYISSFNYQLYNL